MERPLTSQFKKDNAWLGLKAYEARGGYRALRKALKELAPSEITEMVKDSNLLGRGGAGVSTGFKWSFMPMGENARRPKYLICNTDEKEPGSFKDRVLMEGDPHQLIEGIIISAYAVQADYAFLFLRDHYDLSRIRLRKALVEAYEAGYLGKNIMRSDYSLEVHIHVSTGRYICGEETGLLNSLEGKRAIPRAKPPFPQICGLFGKPTVVNNAETLANVPHIVERGVDWYKGLSRSDEGGTKIYGVSGRVKNPGWWELPMGTTLDEIVNGYAGGMKEGVKFRGLLPGGASTDFLIEKHFDVKMDFASVKKAGSRLGTGTIIVMDDRTCPVGFVLNLMHFFAIESCGWCTPCREGLPWIEHILSSIEEGSGEEEDLAILEQQVKLLAPGHTFCALAPGAVEPLQSALAYFRDDFRTHIKKKRCPWRE
jgi:NADH-quinone oxidoreductase subunit F